MIQLYYILLTVIILSFCNAFAQTSNPKEEATKAFKAENYVKAIEILKNAEANGTEDPEIYYLLGYYSHYLAYDSRPLIGYGTKYSNKVLHYLETAIELNPNYGDAYYFLGAEYGARARESFQIGNIKSYIANFRMAYEQGGLPLWLIENGKNILNSCDENAILIVGGDAVINPIKYIQLVEDYRKDITVIPYWGLSWPWYVEKLRSGVEGILRKAPIGMSKEQIYKMHPYKWDTLTIEIPISEKLKTDFQLLADKKFEWKLEPNLKSENRTYLSADRAVLADIVITNKWERPIYFSLGCNPSVFAGLYNNFQLSGLAFKLLPIKTKNTKYAFNPDKIVSILFDKNNIKNFMDVEKHNMPRTSGMLSNYYFVFYKLALYYKEQNQLQKIDEIADYIENNLLTDVLPNGVKMVNKIRELNK
jgi:tetratricopeptide (TPR) repeat protein